MSHWNLSKRLIIFDLLTNYFPQDIVFDDIVPFIFDCQCYYISSNCDEYYVTVDKFGYDLSKYKNDKLHGAQLDFYILDDDLKPVTSRILRKTSYYLDGEDQNFHAEFYENGSLKEMKCNRIINSCIHFRFCFDKDSEIPRSICSNSVFRTQYYEKGGFGDEYFNYTKTKCIKLYQEYFKYLDDAEKKIMNRKY